MDSKTKKLSEIQKAVDEQLRGVALDPMGSVIFGSDDEVRFPPTESEEPFTPPRELSRAEKRQLDAQNDANVAFFRLFGSFGDFDLDNGGRVSPEFKAAVQELERAEVEKFFGPARKESDALNDFVEKATDGFVRFLRRRGTIDIATLAKRASGSGRQYVKRGSERARAARTEKDGEWISEFGADGALIRCYHESADPRAFDRA